MYRKQETKRQGKSLRKIRRHVLTFFKIDYDAVGQVFGIGGPAARMRYKRLKKSNLSGEYIGATLYRNGSRVDDGAAYYSSSDDENKIKTTREDSVMFVDGSDFPHTSIEDVKQSRHNSLAMVQNSPVTTTHDMMPAPTIPTYRSTAPPYSSTFSGARLPSPFVQGPTHRQVNTPSSGLWQSNTLATTPFTAGPSPFIDPVGESRLATMSPAPQPTRAETPQSEKEDKMFFSEKGE